MKSFRAILKKEFWHIFRDARTLALIFIMPIVLVLLFGYTIKNEISNTDIAVLDYSNDKYSKELINKMTVSTYFNLVKTLHSPKEIERTFQQGLVHLVVVIPTRFEENIVSEKTAKIQIITDASNINISTTLTNYTQQIIKEYQDEINEQQVNMLPFEVSLTMQYNPQLESAYMFIPGNIALIMVIVTSLMTSITISREKETGSWRMLAITPANQLTIVIAKIIPYMIISLICTAITILLGVFIFKMPMAGSISLLLLVCLLFMFSACALGILISALTNSQQVAMLACMLGLFLPTLLFSGFIFPVENMPIPLQIFSHAIPAKWFIIALKDVMIKGSGLSSVWLPVVILLGMTLCLIALSIVRLTRKNV